MAQQKKVGYALDRYVHLVVKITQARETFPNIIILKLLLLLCSQVKRVNYCKDAKTV